MQWLPRWSSAVQCEVGGRGRGRVLESLSASPALPVLPLSWWCFSSLWSGHTRLQSVSRFLTVNTLSLSLSLSLSREMWSDQISPQPGPRRDPITMTRITAFIISVLVNTRYIDSGGLDTLDTDIWDNFISKTKSGVIPDVKHTRTISPWRVIIQKDFLR